MYEHDSTGSTIWFLVETHDFFFFLILYLLNNRTAFSIKLDPWHCKPCPTKLQNFMTEGLSLQFSCNLIDASFF